MLIYSKLHSKSFDYLYESNKHICIAEKYGWDTVECYTTDPIASDSDDEKKIKKAVKECQLLWKEKRKLSCLSPNGRCQRSAEWRGA